VRRSLGIVGLKLLGLAVVIYVLSFYLRLGFLLQAVLGAGALVSLAATASEWRSAQSPALAAAGVVAAYLAVQAAIFSALTTESLVERSMRWQIRAASSDARRPEVVLEFEDSPNNYVALYSTQVADYLSSSGLDRVEVQFFVTRDFGCLRGIRETQIGTLVSWETSSGGYTGSAGTSEPPWTNPWWCP
jgi:hypothetical protein